MLAALPERCGQKIRRAVGDEMLFREIRRGGDEDGDLHHADDLFEVAERSLGLRQNIDRAEFCCFLPSGRVHVAPEQACRLQLAVLQRQLARREQKIAASGERQVVCGRRRSRRQRDAQIR
jgi:hypothetical protein